jgi:hypothetical protein
MEIGLLFVYVFKQRRCGLIYDAPCDVNPKPFPEEKAEVQNADLLLNPWHGV